MKKLFYFVPALLALLFGFLSISAKAESLSASPSSVYIGQSVTAAWSGIASPTAQDWIGLYASGPGNGSFVAWRYSDGNAAGSGPLLVPANTAAGTYELRLFANNGYTLLATSNSISLQTPSGSIAVSPATTFSGLSLTATWSAISAPTATDWIALALVGTADSSFVAFRYTDGNASGSGPLLIPANTAPGTYELRLFSNDGYQRLGSSASITIQTPSGNISAAPATVYTGQAVTAAWSAISSPTAQDWIGLYLAGAADTAFVTLLYTDGNAAGSGPLTVPANTAPGTYELRLFSNNGYQRLGTSNSFAVQNQPAATLAVTPAAALPGAQVTAAWTNIAAPTAQDWIGLYAPSAADGAFSAWRYTTATAAGGGPFTIPSNLAHGTYQLRLFSNNGFQRLATSANFTVGPTTKLSFIQVDHLNTPRAVYDDQQQLRWRWDQAEPFGVTTPDENPTTLGTFEFPMRFSGQYSDMETGRTYNYFRDYWPEGGRYVQSDPIGLRAGLNTYAYVGGNPLGLADPTGEAAFVLALPFVGGGSGVANAITGGLAMVGILSVPGSTEQAKPLTPAQEAQKETEYQRYKIRCEEKPPAGLDPCELLRWLLQQAKDCRDMRKNWDDRWMPGRHSQAIRDWGNRIARLERELASKKCGPCP